MGSKLTQEHTTEQTQKTVGAGEFFICLCLPYISQNRRLEIQTCPKITKTRLKSLNLGSVTKLDVCKVDVYGVSEYRTSLDFLTYCSLNHTKKWPLLVSSNLYVMKNLLLSTTKVYWLANLIWDCCFVGLKKKGKSIYNQVKDHSKMTSRN